MAYLSLVNVNSFLGTFSWTFVDTPEYGRNLHAAGERTHRMNEPSGSANMYICIYVYVYIYIIMLYMLYMLYIYIYESYDYKII